MEINGEPKDALVRAPDASECLEIVIITHFQFVRYSEMLKSLQRCLQAPHSMPQEASDILPYGKKPVGLSGGVIIVAPLL